MSRSNLNGSYSKMNGKLIGIISVNAKKSNTKNSILNGKEHYRLNMEHIFNTLYNSIFERIKKLHIWTEVIFHPVQI